MLYRNRFYSPELGRFLQRDPIGYEAGDQNVYRYVGNRVVNEIDPMGHGTYDDCMRRAKNECMGSYWPDEGAVSICLRGKEAACATAHGQRPSDSPVPIPYPPREPLPPSVPRPIPQMPTILPVDPYVDPEEDDYYNAGGIPQIPGSRRPRIFPYCFDRGARAAYDMVSAPCIKGIDLKNCKLNWGTRRERFVYECGAFTFVGQRGAHTLPGGIPMQWSLVETKVLSDCN